MWQELWVGKVERAPSCPELEQGKPRENLIVWQYLELLS